MARFDQAYIPVLALTSQEKSGPARKAMGALRPVWRAFVDKYFLDTHGDDQWQADLEAVGQRIEASARIIQSGEKLKDAHEELEHIRAIMLQLRERNDIEYFIDHLTRFHEPMESIVLAVKDKDAAELSPSDIEDLRETVTEARLLWREVANADLDPALFELDPDAVATVRMLIEQQQAELDRLETAAQKGSRNEIKQAGMAIKPNFAKLFMTFGRFPGGI